jgi:hypothetical protein
MRREKKLRKQRKKTDSGGFLVFSDCSEPWLKIFRRLVSMVNLCRRKNTPANHLLRKKLNEKVARKFRLRRIEGFAKNSNWSKN